ncbi:MAG: DHA1 family bicyclomycin/chloramphenicol resistance-like MFS transporter [Paracoccaceae bacterium]|jgi:DHA1 family bicyclomycin/chloramphenicol resistance-like MFS transporter
MQPAPDPKVGPLFIIVLGATTAFLPLSLHIFFPALPDVKADFMTTEAVANLTISVPLFVMAFASLFYGALSDRYGRRPVLLSSIAVFVAGSICAAAADNIWLLIAGRVLQAAGGGGGLGLARAIARDVFGADRLVKVISYLTMAYALGPMIATPIGGTLVDFAGWRAVLIGAAGFGAVLGLICWRVMFETHTNRAVTGVRFSPMGDYRRLFANLKFSAYVMQSGFSSGIFFTMAAASSFLMIEYLDRPAREFGLFFICFPAGFLTGSLISSRLAGKVKPETMVLAGSVVMVCGALTQAGFLFAGIVTPLTIFLPGYFAIMAQGISLPNAQSGAIIVAGPLAGTAAGIGVFIQLLAAAIFTQIYGFMADGTPFPMAAIVSVSAVCVVFIGAIPYLIARREA